MRLLFAHAQSVLRDTHNRVCVLRVLSCFRINSTLNWAVELLRQGDRKGQHLQRFGGDGKYGPLQAREWRVVDFRKFDSSRPQQVIPRREDGYVAVIMNDEHCRSATAYFPAVEGRAACNLSITFVGSHRPPGIVEEGKDEQYRSLARNN